LLSVTGFPSVSVLGWQSLRMQTDHMAWPSPAAVSALLDPVRGMRVNPVRVAGEAAARREGGAESSLRTWPW
jgi:hypothetical protein